MAFFAELGMSSLYGGKFKRKETKAGSQKKVPNRLKVSGNDVNAQMKGYLYVQHSKTSGWRKVWIVLKDRVLYELRAPEDGTAVKGNPILGYKLEAEYILEVSYLNLKIVINAGKDLSSQLFEGLCGLL